MLNVTDFGALPDAQIVNGSLLGTDNTLAIQAAIDAASGDTVEFGKGSYRCGALNLTNRAPLKLQGAGPAYGGTTLMPTCDGGIFLNCAGTPAVKLSGLTIGDRYNPHIPAVAILHAPTSAVVGADFVHHEDVMVTGRYSKAALCVWGVGTSMAEKCAYWNFYEGEAFSGAFSFDNVFSLESPFCVFAPGAAGCWTLLNCEFHDYQTAGPYQKVPLLLRGTFDTQFIGGVISGSNRLIRCQDPSGQNPPRRLVFMGVRFENEGGTPQPANVLDLVSNLENTSFIRCMQGQSGSFAAGAGSLVGCEII